MVTTKVYHDCIKIEAGLFPVTLPELQENCARLGRCSLVDFESSPDGTAGLRCYREQNISGIRGEAAAGFPAAAMALEALQDWKKKGSSQNDSALYALVHLIARVEDTNMIHRGGAEEAARRRREAQELLPLLSRDTIISRMKELDRTYIAANLSPGGCADLLSLAMALDYLEECGLIGR